MGKFACKRNMDRFVAMDEEGQKDFLFVMLDAMDEFATSIEDEEDEQEKEALKRHLALYETMALFFLDDPEWMKDAGFSSIGFLRRYARDTRKELERKAEENEA